MQQGSVPLTKEAAEKTARSIFVGNIPYEATEEKLVDLFSQTGPVLSFRLVYDRESGKPKGYGFCEYSNAAIAASALRNLQNIEFNGRPLRIGPAAGEQNSAELALSNPAVGPPLESPYGDSVDSQAAPEAISRAVASLPPEQMYELMKQMKLCIQNSPNEARNMLLQNPQLAYALLQAQIVMKIVDPKVAIAMLNRSHDQIPPAMPDGGSGQVSKASLPSVAAGLIQQAGLPPGGGGGGAGGGGGVHGSGPSAPQLPMPPPPSAMQPGVGGGGGGGGPAGYPPNPYPPTAALGPVTGGLPPPGMMMPSHAPRGMPPGMFPPSQPQQPPPPQHQPPFDFPGGPGGPGMRPPSLHHPFPGGPPAGHPMQQQQQQQPPPPPQQPPPGMRPPPQGGLGGGGGSGPQQITPAIAAAAAASMGPNSLLAGQGDQDKITLIMQVLQLSDEQIALLPEDQRRSIRILKEQVGKTGAI